MKKRIFFATVSIMLSLPVMAAQFIIPVKTQVLTASDRARRLISIGTVESRRTTFIQTEIPGRIIALKAHVGDEVTPGMVVAQINPKITADTDREARAQVEKLQMLVNTQAAIVKRARKLEEAGAITGVRLQEQVTKLKVAKQDLKIFQSQAAKAKFALRHTNVKSTVSGRIQEKKVTVGSVIPAGEPIFLIANTKQLHAILPFPQALRNMIQVGDQVELVSPLIPAPKPITAKVSSITPIINPVTRSFNVLVNFDNKEHQWHPGSSVTAYLSLPQKRNFFVIPEVSVVHRESGSFVFVVKDGKPVIRKVITGNYVGNENIEIIKGLHVNEKIVTKGAYFIHPGVGIREVGKG